ncbi:hypothetical protein [Neptunicella sp.]|uniref:hypothetical protein n=1 Tax=Neptunicella sp. TaxID=2125986 RepID=UPI003F68F35F
MVLFSLLGATSAYAQTGSWEEERPRYTIYGSGGYAETLFYNLQTPRTGIHITNVEWNWVGYSNGFDSQTVEICYRTPSGYNDVLCFDISDLQTGQLSGFNGYDPRGTIVLRYTLVGGTYYAYGTSGADDIITVTYSD